MHGTITHLPYNLMWGKCMCFITLFCDAECFVQGRSCKEIRLQQQSFNREAAIIHQADDKDAEVTQNIRSLELRLQEIHRTLTSCICV